MSVYVDEIFRLASREAQAFRVGARSGHQWCHMWADTPEELHAMAALVGMKRAWFQDKPGFPHYDLVPNKRRLALLHGAVVKTARERWAEKQIGKGTATALGNMEGGR